MTVDEAQARTQAGYDGLAWDKGERPSWWLNLSVVWEFVLATGRKFATGNLDEATARLTDHLRQPSSEVRRTLFLQVPLSARDAVTLDPFAVEVTTHRRHSFLRSQTEELARLETFVAQYRNGVIGDVLATFANALGVGETEADRLLDPHDTAFYLGVSLRDLERWAIEFEAFEVQDFIRHERVRPKPQKVTTSTRTQAEKSAHQQLLKSHGPRLREFCHYLNAADFEPRNAHERRALQLHRAMTAAGTAEEEERFAIERDHYLVEFVIGGG
jgi:hypothetical protein